LQTKITYPDFTQVGLRVRRRSSSDKSKLLVGTELYGGLRGKRRGYPKRSFEKKKKKKLVSDGYPLPNRSAKPPPWLQGAAPGCEPQKRGGQDARKRQEIEGGQSAKLKRDPTLN